VSIDKRLVRGLDYYTKTAYEVLSGDLGAQNAVCGGGRYDNLSESIGGPHTPGVGFASGVERIVMTMDQQGCSFGEAPVIDAYVIPTDPSSRDESLVLLYEIRRSGIAADIDYTGRSFKSQFKIAGGSGALFACVMGPDEIASGSVTVKNLKTGEQQQVTRAELPRILAEIKSTEIQKAGRE